MSDRKPVSAIVFDVNETLLDITTLEPLFKRLFGHEAILREWFAELILYSQSLTLSGLYAPFGDLAVAVLQMVGKNKGVLIVEADNTELKALIGSMPAYQDVAPALIRLRDAGFALYTLTNSAPSPSPTPLEKAGIANLFEEHFSVAAVQKFKPHPATYESVTDALGVDASRLCMVACHLWDVIGAQSAGWQGAFIERAHNNILELENVPTPDMIATDLCGFADRMGEAQ